MTERLRNELGGPLSWSTVITVTAPPVLAILIAVAAGVYGYGELSQRVANLEELRPLQLAGDLATIKANQARTILDLGRVQADISEMRRALGTPRRWDRPGQP